MAENPNAGEAAAAAALADLLAKANVSDMSSHGSNDAPMDQMEVPVATEFDLRSIVPAFVSASCWNFSPRTASHIKFLSYYLWELALLDRDLCTNFNHIEIGAAISFVARFTISPALKPWTEQLQQLCGLEARNLQNCIGVIRDLQFRRRGLDEKSAKVRELYSKDEVEGAAKFPIPDPIPSWYYEL